MADVVKTIGTSGADYTTIAAWEAALAVDSADNQIGVFNAAETFAAGATINASNNGGGRIILTGKHGAYTAGYHGGDMAGGAAVERAGAFGDIYSKNVTLRGFRIKNTASTAYLIWTNSAQVSFENMIIDCRAGCTQDALQLTGGADGHHVEGCFIVGKCTTAAADYFVQITNPFAHVIVANTVLLAAGFDSAGGIYQHPNSTGTVKNNIAMGVSGITIGVGCFSGAYTSADVAYNVSSDASATGTGSLTSQTTTDWMTNVSAGTEDLHTKRGKGDLHGANLYGVTTLGYDIDAQTRPNTEWNFGADQLFPEVDVQRPAESSIADGGEDTVSAPIAGIASVLTYTVANTGDGTLTLSNPSISGESNCTATVTANPDASVAVDGDTTFEVTLTPTTPGAFSCTVSMANNDQDENPYNFDLVGTALSADGGNDDGFLDGAFLTPASP